MARSRGLGATRVWRAAVAASLWAAVALALIAQHTAAATRSPQPVPRGWLGVTAGGLLTPDNVDAEVARMRDAGVESLRLPIYWSVLEPQGPGRTDFSTTDRMLAATAQARIRVVPVVLAAPAWASRDPHAFNSPPRDPADYARFMRALVQRYGPHGSFWPEHPALPRAPVRAWEVWNEPNQIAFWARQPFVRPYAALLRKAYTAIKAEDPGATVVLAGVATARRRWPVVRRLYRAARGHFDVVSIHPYTLRVDDVLRLVANARRALRDVGDPRRPLWITELSWPASVGTLPRRYRFEVTPWRQAHNLRRVLPLLARHRRSLGVRRVFWESWMSGYRSSTDPFDYSGLRSPGRDRPGLAAFRAAARALERR